MSILKQIYIILFEKFSNFYSIDYTNNVLKFDKFQIQIKDMYNQSNISNSDIKIEYKNISEKIKYNLGTNLLNKSFHTDISKLNNILNDILNYNLNKNNKHIYNINKHCLEVLYNKYKYNYFQDNKKEKFIYYYIIKTDDLFLKKINDDKIDELYLQSLDLFFKDFNDDKIYKIYTDLDNTNIQNYIDNNKNIINNKNINEIEILINNNTHLKKIYYNIINTDSDNYLINKFKEAAFIKTFNNNKYLSCLLTFLNKNNKLEDFIISDDNIYIKYIKFIISNINDDKIKQNAFIDYFKKNYSDILYLYCLKLFLENKINKDENKIKDLNDYINNYINKNQNTTNITDLIKNTEDYITTNFKDNFNNIFISNIDLSIKKKIMLTYFQKKSNTEELLKQIPKYIEDTSYYNSDYYKHILFYMKDNNIDINVTDINEYNKNLRIFENILYKNINYKNYIFSFNIDKKDPLITYYKNQLFDFCNRLPYNDKDKIIINNLSITNKKNAMLNGLKLADNNNLNYYLEIYLNQENIDINNITKFIHIYLNENYENIIYEYIYSNIYIDYLKKDINFDNYNNNILNNIHLIQNDEYDKFIQKYDINSLHKINNDIISYVIKNNLLKDQTNQINRISSYIKYICNKYLSIESHETIMTSTNLYTYIDNIFTNNDILNTNVIFLYLKCFLKTNNIIKFICDNSIIIIKTISELEKILLSYIFLLNNNNIDILYINDFIFSEYDNNYIFNYKDNITKLYYNIFKNIQIKTFTNCTNLSLYKLNIIDLSYNIIYDIQCDNCNKTTQCNKLFKNFIIDDENILNYNVSCDRCTQKNISVVIHNMPDYLIFYNEKNKILSNYLNLNIWHYNFKLKYVITLNNNIYSLIEKINNNDYNIINSSVYLFYKLCKCNIDGKQVCDC